MITPYLPHPTTHFGAYRTEKISRISTTRNGDILVIGESFVIDSFEIPGESQTKELSGYGGFIARFDTNGKLLWRHFTFPLKKDGSYGLFHVFTDIKEAPDGSIITSGRLERDSSDIPYILDAWLMRLTPEGCLDKDCSHVGRYWMFPVDISPTTEAYQWSTPPSIFPNPGSQRFHIRVSQEVQFPIRYQLKDITGRLYEQGTFDTHDINIHSDYLPSGSFIISLQDHSGKIWHGKWIKA